VPFGSSRCRPLPPETDVKESERRPLADRTTVTLPPVQLPSFYNLCLQTVF